MCRILVEAHVITGDDALSKIGTKHLALVAKPQNFLCSFAELPYITNKDMSSAEKYLVHVWSGAKSKPTATTFNQLRLEVHRKPMPGLHELPPTSSVIQEHIRRAHYVVYNAINLLRDNPTLEPHECSWIKQDGLLLPDKKLNFLPFRILNLCNCAGKCCTRRCSYKAAELSCILYCHKKADKSACENM